MNTVKVIYSRVFNFQDICEDSLVKVEWHQYDYNIYSSKKVLHHSLLFLCILNFQYLWNLEKLSDQAQIFQRMFPEPIFC